MWRLFGQVQTRKRLCGQVNMWTGEYDCVDRYGFNSDGFTVVHDRLRQRNERHHGEFVVSQL